MTLCDLPSSIQSSSREANSAVSPAELAIEALGDLASVVAVVVGDRRDIAEYSDARASAGSPGARNVAETLVDREGRSGATIGPLW